MKHEDDKPLRELFAKIDGNNGFVMPNSAKIAERVLQRLDFETLIVDALEDS